MFTKLILICSAIVFAIFANSSKTVQTEFSQAENNAFRTFLHEIMKNYTNWLSSHDPSLPIPNKIVSTNHRVFDNEIDVKVEFAMQYISGYSQIYLEVFAAIPDLNKKQFNLTRNVTTSDVYIFGGEYSVNGTITVENEEKRFSGKGNWKLETNNTFYSCIYKFKICEDDFISLEEYLPSPIFLVEWTAIEFENLQILEDEGSGNFSAEQNENDEEDYLNRIEKMLAKIYTDYLKNINGFSPIDTCPPQKLQFQYLTEMFSETKLSEIITRWTKKTTDFSSGSDSSIIIAKGYKVLFILQAILIFFGSSQ